MVSARFDDLTPGAEHGYLFADPVDVVVANHVDEVVPAIAAADRAARRGRWAAGYVAYEAASGLDRGLPVHDPLPGLPLVWFGIFPRRLAAEQPPSGAGGYEVSDWTPAMDREGFGAAVSAIRRAIAAGDTYQVNLTFPLHAGFSGDPSRWYTDLAGAQRGAFAAHIDTGSRHILSASPELFFQLDGDRIRTRPMKGTVRRGRWVEEDAAMARWLAGSEKDRAENVMIVDLLRNDLGRIAEVGSVEVDELFAVERYETVWQLTSTVSARVGPHLALVDVFRALFPCGSVTGAPKRSTMGIIRALEPQPRGVYCGAVGFVGPGSAGLGPTAAFNVAIRTVDVDLARGTAIYGVGCGITWGSDIDAEYEEARWKARVLVARRPDFDLFETIRWDPGGGFVFLDRHLDRLAASAGYFGFGFDRAGAVERLHARVAGEGASLRVRLTLDRSGAVEVTASTLLVGFGDDAAADPVRFAVEPLSVAPDNVLLFHKTTARRQFEEPPRRHPEAGDVLLVNDRGELTEFTVANVVLRLDGAWCTPPLESGCLAGVFRAELLAAGTLTERVLTLDDLDAADEVAWINSVRGWRPAVRIESGPAAPELHPETGDRPTDAGTRMPNLR